MPPTHRPLRLEAAILSRIRSEVTSRSNCAKDNRTLSVILPKEFRAALAAIEEDNAANKDRRDPLRGLPGTH